MSRDIVPHDRAALEAKLLAAYRQAEKDGRMDVPTMSWRRSKPSGGPRRRQ